MISSIYFLAFIIIMYSNYWKLYREVLASSVVDANTLVDKHNPTPVLVRVCEEGLFEFAKVLLEKNATVSFIPS